MDPMLSVATIGFGAAGLARIARKSLLRHWERRTALEYPLARNVFGGTGLGSVTARDRLAGASQAAREVQKLLDLGLEPGDFDSR